MTCEPVKTVAPLAEPKTFWIPPEICGAIVGPTERNALGATGKILVGSAVPPEDTNSVPPLTIVVLIVTPPDFTTSVPLISIVVPLALPKTSCSPPASTNVLLAKPPASMV